MRDLRSVGLDVSRETLEKLERYQDLTKRWNPSINLVSKSTLESFWERHIADSAQLLNETNIPSLWLDIGSGGGLPAVVIAILLSESGPDTVMRMVESDVRKCVFLRRIGSELDLNIDVINKRIENLSYQEAPVVTARALAPLEILLGFASEHLTKDGIAVFPKGRTWQEEVRVAEKSWEFELNTTVSVTDPDASILKVKNIKAK